MALIKISYTREEPLPANFIPDRDWFLQQREQLLAVYGECTLLIYQQQVIGKGSGLVEAIADAEANLAEQEGLLTPIMEFLAFTTWLTPLRISLHRLAPHEEV